MQLLTDLATFLANPPGNLVYILAVAFALTGSLQGSISQWRISGVPQARRLVFGLAFLLAIQLTLFLVSGLMEQNVIQGRALLPVFDRTALLLSLIWIIWLWVFPESSRTGDAATMLMSILVVAAGVFGSVAYSSANPVVGSFNASTQAFFWSLGGVLILGLGIGLLFFRKPADWGTGLAVVALAMAGFVLDILLPAEKGDFSGIVRFFMLAAYPLLLTLPMRFSIAISNLPVRTTAVFPENAAETQPPDSAEHLSQAVRERSRYGIDLKTLQSLLFLTDEIDPTKINQYITRSVAQALLVDLCFLIYVGEDKNSLFIATGYDLVRGENIDGGIIKKEAVPKLANAVLRGRPLRLLASTTSSDLKSLGDLLGLSNLGNLLNVPILSEKNPIGSILLLSPYSLRVWNTDDQTFLTRIASSFVPIIERSRRPSEVEQERERASKTTKDALEQALQLKTANEDLVSQLDELKSQLQQAVAQAARLRENELVKPASQLEPDHENLARQDESGELIVSISQELRQPMSSILGYVDLLLGESVGILAALQRKYIEGIRTSTVRIDSLVDDLIQIITFEVGLMPVKSESVDLNLVIDNAMAYTSSQMREKNIILRIDIPENLKPLHADREALQKILIHLLQNAGAASPVEGSVTLRVRLQKEAENENVIIQVSDTGGGIPKKDLPRVFSRPDRAENVLIQGVGDTGVGLLIAKTFTDAHNGRIWVDTQMGSGSMFSVSLPLKSSTSAEIPQKA